MLFSSSVLKIFACVIYFLDIFLQLDPLKGKWMKSSISAFLQVSLQLKIASSSSTGHVSEQCDSLLYF